MSAFLALLGNAAFWKFIGELMGLIGSLYNKFVADKTAAEAAQKAFDIDRAKFHAMVAAAIGQQVGGQPGQSTGAGNAWDQTDPPRPAAPSGGQSPAK
jgi:hypothetical protein